MNKLLKHDGLDAENMIYPGTAAAVRVTTRGRDEVSRSTFSYVDFDEWVPLEVRGGPFLVFGPTKSGRPLTSAR